MRAACSACIHTLAREPAAVRALVAQHVALWPLLGCSRQHQARGARCCGACGVPRSCADCCSVADMAEGPPYAVGICPLSGSPPSCCVHGNVLRALCDFDKIWHWYGDDVTWSEDDVIADIGVGDAFMSREFQSTLISSRYQRAASHAPQLASGSRVMLRPQYGPHAWLHSHPFRYPVYPSGDAKGLVSSHQQQVVLWSMCLLLCLLTSNGAVVAGDSTQQQERHGQLVAHGACAALSSAARAKPQQAECAPHTAWGHCPPGACHDRTSSQQVLKHLLCLLMVNDAIVSAAMT